MQIGNYTIYDNQIKAGNDFFETLIAKKTPVLCSQPQMGKTGTFVYVVSKILEYCRLNNIKNFRIYHAIYISDNSVKKQTINDYTCAFEQDGWINYGYRELLDNGEETIINVIHHADLKKIPIDKDITYFFLSDESHTGLNETGLISQLNNKIKNSACHYYKGYCSATPFTFNILKELLQEDKKDNFIPIILEPSNFYYGISDYNKEKRIYSSFPLFEKNKDTGEFSFTFESSKIIDDFANKVKEFGHGFFLIRDTKKIFDNQDCRESLIQYIKFNHNIDCDFSEFNSREGNIDKLERRLKNGTIKNKSEIIIIKGTLRLGKRLHKQHIRCCLDTPSKSKSNAASVIQALLGRCCGNDVKNNPNDNSDDKFNIYCNISEISDYIKWWFDIQNNNDPMTIPSSNFNKSTVQKITINKCKIKIFDTWEEVNKHRKQFCALPENKKYLQVKYKEEDFRNFENSNAGTISKWNSKDEGADICKLILDEKFYNHRTLIYLVDGPSKTYASSYDRLVNKYPNIIGKYVLFMPTENIKNVSQTINIPTNEHLKKNTILSDKLI